MKQLKRFAPAVVCLLTLATTDSLRAANQEVVIGTQHGKLRYDVEMFTVKPGTEVKLTFNNNDEMQHNLLICQPGAGVTMKVAQAAWGMGAGAMDKQFVPPLPEILFHTRLLNPGQSDSITFTAPNTKGDYPYVCTLPGHAFTMKGVMRVSDAAVAVTVAKADAPPESDKTSRFHLHVMDKPLVKRAYVEDGPARAILVGLPGGINYCFDADTCAVRFGWFGMFLDIGPDVGYNENDRGGSPVKTLGERFSVGNSDLPIRLNSPYLSPQVEFKGYKWNGENIPELHFLINGIPVKETVRPAPKGIGLQYDFEFSRINAPVFLKIDDREVDVSSTAGEYKNGVLSIPHDQAGKFTVIVTTKNLSGAVN